MDFGLRILDLKRVEFQSFNPKSAIRNLKSLLAESFCSASPQSIDFADTSYSVPRVIGTTDDMGRRDLQSRVVWMPRGEIAAEYRMGTRTGRQMQATAQNRAVAEILGVNIQRMVLYTFIINAALAAIASLLISPIYLAKFSNGEHLGLAAFVAAIVGGFNQVRGAIAGGLVVGIVDNLAAAYVSTSYRQAVPLALLVAIILFRPQGLLGRKEERAV